MASRPLATVALLLTIGAAGAADPLDRVCLEPTVAPMSSVDLIRRSVEVLRSCGHAPSSYEVELRDEDPFTLVGEDRPPRRAVVFHPRSAGTGYTVVVSPTAPCAIEWLWQPDELSPRQRAVVERARELVPDEDLDTETGVRVTETRDHFGVRWPGAGRPRIVLSKSDLAVVATEPPGVPSDSGSPGSARPD